MLPQAKTAFTLSNMQFEHYRGTPITEMTICIHHDPATCIPATLPL